MAVLRVLTRAKGQRREYERAVAYSPDKSLASQPTSLASRLSADTATRGMSLVFVQTRHMAHTRQTAQTLVATWLAGVLCEGPAAGPPAVLPPPALLGSGRQTLT